MTLELIYYPTMEEMVGAAAARWVARLKGRDKTVPYGVALSGGRVAGSLFSAVAAEAKGENLDWTEVHFFWADERCVPASDSESNFAIAQQALFSRCGIPSGQIHRIHGEVDPAYAASEAEAELCRMMPLNEHGHPVLNMVFLGMGEDGHVASLFPEESAEMFEDGRVYRPVVATKPPPNRVTIGYQVLKCANEVWIIASGKGKRGALEAAVQGKGDLPVVRLVKDRPLTLCFNDIVPQNNLI